MAPTAEAALALALGGLLRDGLELWKTRAGVGLVCAGWSGLLQMEPWRLQVLV